MKKYNIILMVFAIFLVASCAEDDLPQPDIQTFQMTGNVNALDEFGEAIMGLDLSDVNMTFIRQGFETITGSTSANADGSYSFADLPIREYGIVIEKDGFNQVLGSNDFAVNSSAVAEQRMVVDIPESASESFFTQNFYLRQESSTEATSANASRDIANPTAEGVTTTISGSIDNGMVSTGFKRGVYAYFSNATPTNEEDGALYAVLIPIDAGNTSFSFDVTDLTLINNGFSSGSNVNIAFYGVTLNESDELVTIANSTVLLESAIFTLP